MYKKLTALKIPNKGSKKFITSSRIKSNRLRERTAQSSETNKTACSLRYW